MGSIQNQTENDSVDSYKFQGGTRMIYMDNAATTPVCARAKEAMLPFLDMKYANPSGAYEFAMESRQEVENARTIVAKCLVAKPEEIYFTSGGTESNNWALTSIMTKEKTNCKSPHLITSQIEHHAILNTCGFLERNGVKVTYLPVNEYGQISIRELKESITEDTRLISIMYANNEIGTVEPIYEIGRVAKANNILFHTDAVQAFGHLAIDVRRANIDLLSASGHKFGGQKGTGFLYVNENVDIEPMIFGGGQEKGRRSGTENVSGIVGLGAAAKYHYERLYNIAEKEKAMRNYMISQIRRKIRDVKLNGHPNSRLPGNINLSFRGINGASIVVMLDMDGICISSGSACSTGSGKPSHVLKAIGLEDDMAYGSIRITLSEYNTRKEADYVVSKLVDAVNELKRKGGLS